METVADKAITIHNLSLLFLLVLLLASPQNSIPNVVLVRRTTIME